MKHNTIKDAVSIILKHNDKIFPIVRQNYLNSFPGYTAFPGGKVDPQDYKPHNHSLLKNFEPHLIKCLIREAKEELQIDVIELLEAKVISKIDYIAKAVTPSFNPYRFATYFFVIHLNSLPKIILDENEAKIGEWLTPLKILEQYNLGKRLCVPPVRWIIEKLDQIKTPIIYENRFDLDNVVPYTESIKGITQIMPLSDTLPPADRTNAFIIGDLLIDPSPKDEKELKKFLNVIKRFKFKSIFLTHHHKDHYQNLQALTDYLGVEVLLSEDTFFRISKKEDKNFFKNIKTKIVKDNEVVTTWLGKDVIAMSIPGHDEGQLGLYPISKEWFLAGDLFQGIGTVVISTDEGDMTKYFNTLEKVIELSPTCVIPSHGIALGGVNILQKTLKHRKMREEQVFKLASLGKNNDEMLQEIYPNLARSLHNLALENIKSHLIKLKKELKLL